MVIDLVQPVTRFSATLDAALTVGFWLSVIVTVIEEEAVLPAESVAV